MDSVFDTLNEVLGSGSILGCKEHQDNGECSCCQFGDNWISLLPGELEYLTVKNGIAPSHLYQIDQGVAKCSSDKHPCTVLPIDCKLYPFFPVVTKKVHNVYHIDIYSSDTKCPLTLRGYEEKSTDKLSAHLYNVFICAVVLFDNGYADWMVSTSKNFVGYRKYGRAKFVVPIMEHF